MFMERLHLRVRQSTFVVFCASRPKRCRTLLLLYGGGFRPCNHLFHDSQRSRPLLSLMFAIGRGTRARRRDEEAQQHVLYFVKRASVVDLTVTDSRESVLK
jgi:hypothetical protein